MPEQKPFSPKARVFLKSYLDAFDMQAQWITAVKNGEDAQPTLAQVRTLNGYAGKGTAALCALIVEMQSRNMA